MNKFNTLVESTLIELFNGTDVKIIRSEVYNDLIAFDVRHANGFKGEIVFIQENTGWRLELRSARKYEKKYTLLNFISDWLDAIVDIDTPEDAGARTITKKHSYGVIEGVNIIVAGVDKFFDYMEGVLGKTDETVVISLSIDSRKQKTYKHIIDKGLKSALKGYNVKYKGTTVMIKRK